MRGKRMRRRLLRRWARVVTVSERGDVPGWVLVAVMTAGLVTSLWIVADDQLSDVLQQAIESVSR